MDLDFLSGIGWRYVVLAVAAMIGIYLVLSVLRLFKVGGTHRSSAPKVPDLALDLDLTPQSSPEPPPLAPDFARELARSNVEVELERVRRESAVLREELARLTEEVARLKATRTTSPQYSEATVLAQQGMPASGIAGHCGISIGEAELVAAMARGGSEFKQNEQGEDRDERDTDYRKRFDH